MHGGGLEARGYEIEVIHPSLFHTFPLPTYPEIKTAILPGRKIRQIIKRFQPDYIHIATEGSLGVAAKRYLDKYGWRYTTSLHTQFPEYVNERAKWIKVSWGYSALKWFHGRAANTFVTTPTMHTRLVKHGLNADKMVIWGRGVNTSSYKPDESVERNQTNPLLMYVGRVAVEKNLAAFLDAKVAGRKRIVGDGPQMETLRQQYPDVEFVGYRYGEALVAEYQQADVFVFPSKTDTFGLVMLEALACGTPVAAFPVTGPIDVIENGVTGALNEDLGLAIQQALQIDRQACRDFALANEWDVVIQRLIDGLALNKRAH